MRRMLKSVTSFAGLLLLSGAIWTAHSSGQSKAPAPTSPCSVEQVALRTADGILLDGVLYRPAANSRPTAILLVHGFGSNFYSGYFPLLGQSMGTNRVLYYQVTTGDPTIAASLLVSGPGNLFEWNVLQLGRKKAQASVDEALALQTAGHEQQFMLVDLGPLGKALYTARYLLSLRGPKARSDPYQNIQKLKNPILVVQGTADKLVEPYTADRLKRAAIASPTADLISFEGADHTFRGQEAVLAQRILAWLKAAAP